MEAYVDEHLVVKPGAKLLQRDIFDDFKRQTEIEELSFKAKDFFAALQKAIAERGPEFQQVQRYNGRDGSMRKDANGKDIGKGMLYANLTFKDATKAPWNAWNAQTVTTHDLYTADLRPCEG